MFRVLALAVLGLSFTIQASLVGTLPGELIVDQGVAQYQIPLSLPTGRGGNTPQLSLIYSSQGSSNSIVGPGFSLSGLSAINRCGSTISTDGVARDVSFSEHDNFCLDGARLLTAKGIKGKDGSVYRPEMDNFSQITLHGDATEIDSYFTVKTKGGDYLTYQAHTHTGSWLVSKITNTTGKNPHLYTYNSQSQITQIKYDIFTIDFSYKSYQGLLNDKVKLSNYKFNNQIYTNNKLLDKITIKGLSKTLNFYEIERRGKKSTDTSSLIGQTITAIKYCDGNNACLPKTRFDWAEQPTFSKDFNFLNTIVKSQTISGLSTTSNLPNTFWGDLEGDRALDLCLATYSGNKITHFNCQLNIQSDSPDAVSYTLPQPLDKDSFWWIDINGDGKNNLCRKNSDALICSTFSVDGKVTDISLPMQNWGQEQFSWWFDFDGNGRIDFCRKDGDNLRCSMNKDGQSWNDDRVIKNIAWGKSEDITWSDIDGNGSADLCSVLSGGLVCTRFNKGNVLGDKNQRTAISDLGDKEKRWWLDINGDGATDFCRATGKTSSTDSNLLCSFGSNGEHSNFADDLTLKGGEDWSGNWGSADKRWWNDFNQDGKLDFCRDVSGAMHCVNMYGEKYQFKINDWGGAYRWWLDLNNDGHVDFCRNIGSKLQCDSNNETTPIPYSLVKITNGLGYTSSVTFGLYSKHGEVAKKVDFPYVALPGEMLVPYRLDADNGMGTNSFVFHYGPALYQVLGQGNTGFSWIKQREFVNGKNNRNRYVTFNTEYPFNRTVRSTKEYLSDSRLLSSDCSECLTESFWNLSGLDVINQSISEYTKREIDFTSKAVKFDRTEIEQTLVKLAQPFEQFDVEGNTYLKKPDLFIPIASSVMVPVIIPSTEYYRLNDKTLVYGEGESAVYKIDTRQLTTTEIANLKNQAWTPKLVTSAVDTSFYDELITKNYVDTTLKNIAVYVSRNTSTSYDLAGKLITTVDTINSRVDQFGNVERVQVATSAVNPISNKLEIFTKVTENKYLTDDESRWLLGRVSENKVTYTDAFGQSSTKTKSMEYDGNTGLLLKEVLQPGSSLGVTTENVRDSEGRITTTKVTALHGTSVRTKTNNQDVVYSGSNMIKTKVNPLGFTTTEQTDRVSNTHISKDINGLETRYFYDSFGRLQETWVQAQSGFNKSKVNRYFANASQCSEKPDDRAVYCVVTTAANGGESIVFYDLLEREIRRVGTGLNDRSIFTDTFYNVNNQVVKSTRAYYKGDTPQYYEIVYDALGRVIAAQEPGPAGKSISWVQNQYGPLWSKRIDAKGRETTKYLNATGLTIQVDQPEGTYVKNTFTPTGLLSTATSANGNVVVNQYDDIGNKISVKDPDLGLWSYSYDGFGQLVSQTDAKGQTQTMSYDDLGRMISRIETTITPGAPTTESTTNWYYDQSGSESRKGALIKVEQPGEYIKQFYYTSLGQVSKEIQITAEQTLTREFIYNQYGQVVTEQRPNRFILNYDYDTKTAVNTGIWGDISQLQLNFTKEEYNKVIKPLIVASLAKAQDYIAKAKELTAQQYVYDSRQQEYAALKDEIITVDSATNMVATFNSELTGLALDVYEDANGEKYYQVPDRFILIASSVSVPIIQKAQYHLKLEGNTVRKVSFEEWNSLSSELTQVAQTAYYGDFTQDGSGNIATIAIERDDPLYDTRLKDYFNRLISLASDIQRLEYVQDHTSTKAQTYLDAAEQLMRLVKQTQLVAARYEDLGSASQQEHDQLASIKDGNGTGKVYYWKLAQLDAEGRIFSEVYGNGLTNNYDYNEGTGQLQSINTLRGQDNIRSLHYVYDRLNNVTQRSDITSGIIEHYSYDNLDRLISNSVASSLGLNDNNPLFNRNYSVSYDQAGNIKSKTDVGAYAYTDLKHAHAVTQAGERTYSYDANGNMLTGDGRTFIWSGFNKPTRITKGSNWVSFAYGPDRLRYQKTNQAGDKTLYLGKTYERIDHRNGEVDHKQFITAAGKLIAINIERKKSNTEGVSASFDRQIRYMHSDALGSVDLITDSFANVVDRKNYDAWGKARTFNWAKEANSITQLTMTNRGYTSHEQVAEIDLINMNARLYDSTLGRFISADSFIQAPDNSQSFNRYTYVLNNPMKYTDPSGHFSFKKSIKRAARNTKRFVKRVTHSVMKRVVKVKYLNQILQVAACVYGGPAGCAAYANLSTVGLTGSFNNGLRAGAFAYAGAKIYGVQNPFTNIRSTVAFFASSKLNREQMAGLNFFMGGIGGGVGNTASNFAISAMNTTFQGIVEKQIAKKVGLELNEFNILLQINSEIGRLGIGTSVKTDGGMNRVYGFASRDDSGFLGSWIGAKASAIVGVLWDANDTVLGYQGEVDAIGRDMVRKIRGLTIDYAHSLGSLRAVNLVHSGQVKSANVYSLPIGNVGGSNVNVTNGSMDFVNGFKLGGILNPGSVKTTEFSFGGAGHTGCTVYAVGRWYC